MQDYKNTNEEIRLKIKYIKELAKIDIKNAKKKEDLLVLSLSYLVHSVVKKYRNFDNYEDLYQEGMIGLIKAIRQFNSNLTFHFTRYAMWWIKARVIRAIKRTKILQSGDGSMESYNCENDFLIDIQNIEDDTIVLETLKKMRKALLSLSNQEHTIIAMRYGLYDNQNQCFRNVASELKTTRENVRQSEIQILHTIKNLIK